MRTRNEHNHAHHRLLNINHHLCPSSSSTPTPTPITNNTHHTNNNSNAFQIFPPSAAKNVGIVLMVAHQLVAFALFILPVCVMWEKLCRTSAKPTPVKVLSRVPVALLLWFIALAVPFFGVINDLLGAFAVTLETYVIPAVAWSIFYWKKERRDAAVIKPPR